ncbi:hypothetical protein ABZ611_24650 [Streptomyces sp. NPDC007861]|uniref:hypothetical protein n=1 Tax=Streptomyces sp. NPDC007861 TaxID=3154893 RepID=UPI0033E5E130
MATTDRSVPACDAPSTLINRRTVLGGAVAGAAALALLPQAGAVAESSAGAAPVDRFPFPGRPGRPWR